MAERFKICPICDAQNHANAAICNTCGASLTDVEVATKRVIRSGQQTDYDFRYGETDLLEQTLNPVARSYAVIGITLLVAIVVGGLLLTLGSGMFSPAPSSENSMLVDDDTATPMPTQVIMTVTLGPPTATATYTPSVTYTPSATFTPEPCIYTIPAGGALTWALTNCGYQSLDVLPTVLALNNLQDAASVNAGQRIIVPWPTATLDPNAVTEEAEPDPDGQSNNADDEADSDNMFVLNTDIDAFAPTATPTLPAGVMWHTVQQGEYISSIIINYNADVKVLSELNPQVDFARCEFGDRFGGRDCIVQLFPGQQLRVPAPTPTPTLSPTPDPNSTATPTPTATYNIPILSSPADRVIFLADEIIRLRWIPSATLNPNEAYRIDVTDLTSGASYTGYTGEISFEVPLDWQGTDGKRHNYEWRIGIVDQSQPEVIRQQTATRTFVWQAKSESE